MHSAAWLGAREGHGARIPAPHCPWHRGVYVAVAISTMATIQALGVCSSAPSSCPQCPALHKLWGTLKGAPRTPVPYGYSLNPRDFRVLPIDQVCDWWGSACSKDHELTLLPSPFLLRHSTPPRATPHTFTLFWGVLSRSQNKGSTVCRWVQPQRAGKGGYRSRGRS